MKRYQLKDSDDRRPVLPFKIVVDERVPDGMAFMDKSTDKINKILTLVKAGLVSREEAARQMDVTLILGEPNS